MASPANALLKHKTIFTWKGQKMELSLLGLIILVSGLAHDMRNVYDFPVIVKLGRLIEIERDEVERK